MKKSIVKDIFVLIVMLAVMFLIIQFLPDGVPIHFNARGEADMVINKYFLLLGTVIPYSAYWQILRGRKGKK